MPSDLAAVYTLDHHYKIAPEGLHDFDAAFFRINRRYVEVPLFQFHVINYQSTIFHVEDFHRGAIP